MIFGAVDQEDVPVVELVVAGQKCVVVIDTGFNGDLELPIGLRHLLQTRFISRQRSSLAGGVSIEEDLYEVSFPFDGETVTAEATFVSGGTILIGTHMLRRHRLDINFVARTVLIEKVP